MDIGGVDDHHIFFRMLNVSAQTFQNGKQNTDIGNVRNIFNSAYAVYQQRSRQNGDGGIFRAADGDATLQPGAAYDLKSSQRASLFLSLV